MSTNTTQSEHNIVDFDSTYDLQAQAILKKLIKNEISKRGYHLSHLSTKSLDIKRSILLIILGLVTMISAACYFFYLSPITCLTMIVITWFIGILFYKNLTLEKALNKKAISNPDLDIASIIQDVIDENRTTIISPVTCFLLTCILSIAIPIAVFYQPKIFYSSYEDGYAVERYTRGVMNPTEVTIPDVYKNKAVVAINSGAFQDSMIEQVNLPESIVYIGGEAFCNAQNLQYINIPSHVTEIKGNTFENCTSLIFITLPEGLERINGSAFNNCTHLFMITLPESLTYLGAGAFASCSSLQLITIPQNVTEINGQTFAYCTSLSKITLHDNITNISGEAFMECRSLDNVILPSKITEIHGNTFENCTSLTSIDIPEGVTRIGGHAFYGCSSLQEVSIPSSMLEIGSSAFRCCYSLETVSVPNGTSINERAFKESPTKVTRY